jgi:hypothetical protein
MSNAGDIGFLRPVPRRRIGPLTDKARCSVA